MKLFLLSVFLLVSMSFSWTCEKKGALYVCDASTDDVRDICRSGIKVFRYVENGDTIINRFSFVPPNIARHAMLTISGKLDDIVQWSRHEERNLCDFSGYGPEDSNMDFRNEGVFYYADGCPQSSYERGTESGRTFNRYQCSFFSEHPNVIHDGSTYCGKEVGKCGSAEHRNTRIEQFIKTGKYR